MHNFFNTRACVRACDVKIKKKKKERRRHGEEGDDARKSCAKGNGTELEREREGREKRWERICMKIQKVSKSVSLGGVQWR